VHHRSNPDNRIAWRFDDAGIGFSDSRRKFSVRKAAGERHLARHSWLSDNGPEFVAKAVQEWITAVGAKTAYIEPGSPWENGYVESFNARLHDGLLDGEIFYTLREAQIVNESWRRQSGRMNRSATSHQHRKCSYQHWPRGRLR
jgi:transposase InsO family protein